MKKRFLIIITSIAVIVGIGIFIFQKSYRPAKTGSSLPPAPVETTPAPAADKNSGSIDLVRPPFLNE